jgi:hypothetical protein
MYVSLRGSFVGGLLRRPEIMHHAYPMVRRGRKTARPCLPDRSSRAKAGAKPKSRLGVLLFLTIVRSVSCSRRGQFSIRLRECDRNSFLPHGKVQRVTHEQNGGPAPAGRDPFSPSITFFKSSRVLCFNNTL